VAIVSLLFLYCLYSL